jgi:hypothetical protein
MSAENTIQRIIDLLVEIQRRQQTENVCEEFSAKLEAVSEKVEELQYRKIDTASWNSQLFDNLVTYPGFDANEYIINSFTKGDHNVLYKISRRYHKHVPFRVTHLIHHDTVKNTYRYGGWYDMEDRYTDDREISYDQLLGILSTVY